MSVARVGPLRRGGRLALVAAHLLVGLAIVHTVFRVAGPVYGSRAPAYCAALTRWWAARLCRLLRLRLNIRGAPARGPVLVVANHVSWLDIPCLLTAIDAIFVAKGEVARWPVVGSLATRTGTLFIPRGEGQTAAVADRMTWCLARRSIIMFPEGTTTDGSAVRRFHSRLFQAAIRTGRLVQPVAIQYTDAGGRSRAAPFVGDDDLVRHLWRLLGQESIAASIHILPARGPGGDRRALAQQVRAQVCGALGIGVEPVRAGACATLPQ